MEEADDTIEFLMQNIRQAARETLTEKPQEINKPCITKETREKIMGKKEAVMRDNWAAVEHLKQEIVKRARDDKRRHTLEEPEHLDGKDGYTWDGLKRFRKPFNPSRTKLKNANGTIIEEVMFAEEATNYLNTQHWN
jgi:hypothetical protein